jgi:predicted ATPase/transcriptional regulator with XRE-family HTH domain
LEEVPFGEWLKRQRSSRGLTQDQLAQQIGCATITLRKIESEQRRPSAQMIERIAEIFNIPKNEKIIFSRFTRGGGSAPLIKSEAAPWSASSTTVRSNLPASLTSFIGREQDIALVCEYLLNPDIRIVTLIGPPGIGKTRLSLAAAHEVLSDFAEGIFFVALAPLEDSSLAAPTIVQTLGFAETERRSPLDRLKEGIGDKDMLLVLDNLEHIIDGAASLASDLLSACPHLKILTTSREALRIPGEWLYSVPVFSIPQKTQLQSMNIEEISKFAALTLFAERARAVKTDFVLDSENVQAVAAICTQLDGLPLAIELIAARVRLMSPQALLAKLNNQFTLTADGMRAVPARQKTLQNAISWSYNLLSQEEQNLFAGLSVFSGGFTVDAAEAIFSRTVISKPIPDLVASLLDKSLLQRTSGLQGEPRFSMLVTIQQFSLDRLRQRGEQAQVRNWHLDYFLDLAEQADQHIHGLDQVSWLEHLDAEHANYSSALDWCLSNQYTELALRLLGALGWALILQRQSVETYGWFDKVHALPGVMQHPALHARVLNLRGLLGWFLNDIGHARFILEESQEIWLQLEDQGEQGLAEALSYLGLVLMQNDDGDPQPLFEKSYHLYQKHADQWGMAFAMLNSGRATAGLFHPGGSTTAWHGDDRALSLFQKSLGMFGEVGDLWGVGRACFFLGQLFVRQGNHVKARSFLDQYLMICEDLGFRQGIAFALLTIGDSYRHQSDYDQAAQFYEKSQVVSRQYDLKESQMFASLCMGLVALHLGDYLQATRNIKEFHNICRMNGFSNVWTTYDLFTGFAGIAAGTNQFERSAKMYGAAQALSNVIDIPIAPVECESLVQIAREQLGIGAFELLSAEGAAMTLEQAMAYALATSYPG